MKKFTEIYKNKKLDLSKYEKEIQEKFSNLNGQQINECCCDCCCGEPQCCSTELCGNTTPSFPIKFYNERDIVKKIVESLTVQDIYEIHAQFEMCGFRSAELANLLTGAPLYFNEEVLLNTTNDGLLTNNFCLIRVNKKISSFIKTLTKKYGISYALVLCNINGGIAIYGIKNTGTNGKEGSIKNSLKEIYDMMNSIEENEEVSSISCCNISIDCADDVYDFVIRIGLDKIFVLNALREENQTI